MRTKNIIKHTSKIIQKCSTMLLIAIMLLNGINSMLSAQKNVANNSHTIPKLVANSYELNNAIAEAKPGSVIMLKSGTWTDVHIHFKAMGTATSPIRLLAEKPGHVTLTGNSHLTIDGDYLQVEALYFKNGLLSGSAPVVAFTQSSQHCQLSHTAIVDYSHTQLDTRRRWITVDGSHHKLHHCYFKGKSHMGPLLRNMPGSKHNHFYNNYFVDIPAFPNNGLEIIQVMSNSPGGEPTTTDGEYLLIENNLFERAHGESAEIISLKSSFNTVRNNTIRNTKGGIVIRSGHYNVVTDNYIESDENISGTAGIRITGEGNRVSNNIIKGLSSYGIVLMAGEYIDSALTKDWIPSPNAALPNGRVAFYNQTRNSIVEKNILINNKGTDIWIGFNYMDKWPRYQYILLPSNNIIRDNKVVKAQGIAYRIEKANSQWEHFNTTSNQYSNNKLFALSAPTNTYQGIQFVPIKQFKQNKALANFKPLTKADVGPDWMH